MVVVGERRASAIELFLEVRKLVIYSRWDGENISVCRGLIFAFCLLLSHIGLDKIEFLQSHENQDIYQKAFDLIEHYFGSEDEDSSIAPQVDLSQQQYIFQQCEAPMEGFQL